jgi:NAD(P)H-flavin reductase
MISPPDPWIPAPRRVLRARRETRDTFTVELESDNRAFAPGQFNMLYLFGIGEVPISISGDPGNPNVLVHTIRAVGTTTLAMKRQAKRGGMLGVRGPFGSAWPVREADGGDLLIMAGGLGLAPLRPVIYYALRHRQRFGRVTLLYGARTPEDLLYRSEHERWRSKSCTVDVIVDRAAPDWTGRVGVVPALVKAAPLDPERTTAMLCGPEVMMRFSVRALEACGLSHERIYVSMERSMKCATGFCGHCQFGPTFVCKDGPVLRLDRVARLFGKREI